MLAIEIINQCNFKCYFCGAGNTKEPLEIINLDTIKTLIKDINELKITYLKLTPSRGEIFLHPDIYEILKLFTNSNLKTIEFHTNFSKINFDKLTTNGINLKKLKIHVSHYGCDGIEEFKYQTRAKDKFFYKIEENIQLAKQYGINIELSNRNRFYDYDCETQSRINVPKITGVCSNLWVPRILSNGDFNYCTCSGEPTDLTKDAILGNIYKTNFKDLYLDGKRYKLFKDFKDGITPDICKTCTSFSSNQFQPTINSLKNFNICKQNWNNNGK
jgi:organic radical activating enzyme